MDFQNRILEIDKELTALEGAIAKRKQEREALVVLSALQKDAFDVVLRPKTAQAYTGASSAAPAANSSPVAPSSGSSVSAPAA